VAFGVTRDRLPSVIHTATDNICFRTPCSTHNEWLPGFPKTISRIPASASDSGSASTGERGRQSQRTPRYRADHRGNTLRLCGRAWDGSPCPEGHENNYRGQGILHRRRRRRSGILRCFPQDRCLLQWLNTGAYQRGRQELPLWAWPGRWYRMFSLTSGFDYFLPVYNFLP